VSLVATTSVQLPSPASARRRSQAHSPLHHAILLTEQLDGGRDLATLNVGQAIVKYSAAKRIGGQGAVASERVARARVEGETYDRIAHLLTAARRRSELDGR
jgi:hypothetical protein